MTGNELLLEFDAVVANDLYPIASTTTAAKLVHLNIAARHIMEELSLVIRSVSVPITTGVSRYDTRLLATPIGNVTLVKFGNTQILKSNDPLDFGWTQYDFELEVNFKGLVTGNSLTIDGYRYPTAISATNTPIMFPPEALHLAIVQLAIVEACVGHEDTQEQQLRLSILKQSADTKIARRVDSINSKRFPSFTSRRRRF